MTPAFAQDHSGHAMPAAQSPAQTECEKEAARHRSMGHAVPEGACEPTTQPSETASADLHESHSGMDHSQMKHSQMEGMDHPAMDHSNMESMDHAAMGHEGMQSSGQAPMDHQVMDHGAMEHGAMDHGAMDMPSIPQGPPPAAAGSGPPRAADARLDRAGGNRLRRDRRAAGKSAGSRRDVGGSRCVSRKSRRRQMPSAGRRPDPPGPEKCRSRFD